MSSQFIGSGGRELAGTIFISFGLAALIVTDVNISIYPFLFLSSIIALELTIFWNIIVRLWILLDRERKLVKIAGFYNTWNHHIFRNNRANLIANWRYAIGFFILLVPTIIDVPSLLTNLFILSDTRILGYQAGDFIFGTLWFFFVLVLFLALNETINLRKRMNYTRIVIISGRFTSHMKQPIMNGDWEAVDKFFKSTERRYEYYSTIHSYLVQINVIQLRIDEWKNESRSENQDMLLNEIKRYIDKDLIVKEKGTSGLQRHQYKNYPIWSGMSFQANNDHVVYNALLADHSVTTFQRLNMNKDNLDQQKDLFSLPIFHLDYSSKRRDRVMMSIHDSTIELVKMVESENTEIDMSVLEQSYGTLINSINRYQKWINRIY